MFIGRRWLLSAALAAVPAAAAAQVAVTRAKRGPGRVAAADDREGKKRAIGLSESRYKVLTRDSVGALFVLEQTNRRRGGPTRHLHHGEDELFYVMAGRYLVEVGGEEAVLEAGDCVLGPRGIPHGWAFIGDGVGKMLISFAPAGKMEAFFAARETMGLKPGEYSKTAQDAAVLEAFGMTLVGPALDISRFG